MESRRPATLSVIAPVHIGRSDDYDFRRLTYSAGWDSLLRRGYRSDDRRSTSNGLTRVRGASHRSGPSTDVGPDGAAGDNRTLFSIDDGILLRGSGGSDL